MSHPYPHPKAPKSEEKQKECTKEAISGFRKIINNSEELEKIRKKNKKKDEIREKRGDMNFYEKDSNIW